MPRLASFSCASTLLALLAFSLSGSAAQARPISASLPGNLPAAVQYTAPVTLYSPISPLALKADREAREARHKRKSVAGKKAKRRLDAGSLETARATAHVKTVNPKDITTGQFEATAYGPPWDCATCMEGTGVTATGTNLGQRAGQYRKLYIVATDPQTVPTGSWVYVWPNPFGYRGAFKADDVGGAIKGRKIDFYDWRGRKTQNQFGRRQVTLTAASGPGLGAGDNKLGKLAFRYVNLQRQLVDLTSELTDQRELVNAAKQQHKQAQDKAAKSKRELKRMTVIALRAQSKLDEQTRQYLKLTRGVSIAPATQASGQTDDVLRYAADSGNDDAVLVWSTASVLLNRKSKLLADLQESSAGLEKLQSDALVAHRRQQQAVAEAARAQKRQKQAEKRIVLAARSNRKAILKLEQTLKEMGVGDSKGPISITDLLVDPRFSPPDAAKLLGKLTLAQRIVLLARQEYDKHVAERPLGSNESPDIARYRSAVALSWPNTAWCAYFTSYIARRAGAPLGYTGEGFAAVAAARAWAQSEGSYFASSSAKAAKAGDIVFWPEHIGLVIKVSGKSITTIEGNSSDRVSMNTHSRGSVMGFARLYSPSGK